MKAELTDLKRPKPKKGDFDKDTACVPSPYHEPYAYGLRINLGTEELKKLDIDVSELAAGSEISIKATGQIIEVRNSEEIIDGKSRKDQRLEIQIQKMALTDGEDFEGGFEDEDEE